MRAGRAVDLAGVALLASLALPGLSEHLAGSAMLAAQEPSAGARPPEIAVTGTGSVTLAPDYAVLAFSVTTRDAQAARAGQENARLMSAVRAALRTALQVPDDSLPTVWYTVSPDYERGRQVGYQVQSAVQATVRDLRRLGSAIDAALGAGATAIRQLQFDSSRREAAELEALGRAVQSARRQAEAVAQAAGGRLGALLAITTSAPVTPAPQVSMRAALAEAETPITPPALEITATVSARWSFVPQ